MNYTDHWLTSKPTATKKLIPSHQKLFQSQIIGTFLNINVTLINMKVYMNVSILSLCASYVSTCEKI